MCVLHTEMCTSLNDKFINYSWEKFYCNYLLYIRSMEKKQKMFIFSERRAFTWTTITIMRIMDAHIDPVDCCKLFLFLIDRTFIEKLRFLSLYHVRFIFIVFRLQGRKVKKRKLNLLKSTSQLAASRNCRTVWKCISSSTMNLFEGLKWI